MHTPPTQPPAGKSRLREAKSENMIRATRILVLAGVSFMIQSRRASKLTARDPSHSTSHTPTGPIRSGSSCLDSPQDRSLCGYCASPSTLLSKRFRRLGARLSSTRQVSSADAACDVGGSTMHPAYLNASSHVWSGDGNPKVKVLHNPRRTIGHRTAEPGQQAVLQDGGPRLASPIPRD